MTPRKPIPPLADHAAALLNRLFEDAVRLHGGDWERVLQHVKAESAALLPADRAALARAFELAIAGGESSVRRGPLN